MRNPFGGRNSLQGFLVDLTFSLILHQILPEPAHMETVGLSVSKIRYDSLQLQNNVWQIGF